MTTTNDLNQPRFCSDRGLSLVMLETPCTSSICGECGKEIYFVRRGEDGGIRIEEGEKFHIPQITLSLDPKISARFFRPGLESFIKQMFLEKSIPPEKLIEIYKETEARIDKELNNLDCIQHCDLESDSGVEEALKILETEGLHEYIFDLIRSSNLRKCYVSIENGDALEAAYASHQAALFKEYSLLENHHLKEIIWLGYGCYVELCKNEGLNRESAKEQRLIKGALPKIANIETELLYAIANDGNNIGVRLGLCGISESTLKSLLLHELDRRTKDKEEYFKNREIAIKEKDNRLKIWGFMFTLANAVILVFYKKWIG